MIDGALTERQMSIVRRRCQGVTRDEIADADGISISTIRNHLESAYRRLGIPLAMSKEHLPSLCYQLGREDTIKEAQASLRRRAGNANDHVL